MYNRQQTRCDTARARAFFVRTFKFVFFFYFWRWNCPNWYRRQFLCFACFLLLLLLLFSLLSHNTLCTVFKCSHKFERREAIQRGWHIFKANRIQKSLYLSHFACDLGVLLAKLDADGRAFIRALSQMALFCQRCIITATIYSMNLCAVRCVRSLLFYLCRSAAVRIGFWAPTEKYSLVSLKDFFSLALLICRPRRWRFLFVYRFVFWSSLQS